MRSYLSMTWTSPTNPFLGNISVRKKAALAQVNGIENRSLVFATMFVVLMPLLDLCAEIRKPKCELDPQIRQAYEELTKMRSSIKSLKITYADFLQSASVLNYRFNENDSIVYWREFSFSENSVYYKKQTISYGNSPVAAFPPQVYLTSSTFNKWWPNTRYLLRKPVPENARRDILADDHYLQAVGLWAAGLNNPDPSAFALPFAITQPTCRLISTSGEIDGCPCWKITNDIRDELWLDPGIGYQPRKRIWRSNSNQAGDERLTSLYELKDYREFAPGVWLPIVVQHTRFDAKPGVAPMPFVVGQMLLSQVIVNDARLEDVKPDILPGTIIDDESAPISRTIIPGGQELLESAAIDIKNEIRFIKHKISSDGHFAWLDGLLNPFVVAIIVYFVFLFTMRLGSHFVRSGVHQL